MKFISFLRTRKETLCHTIMQLYFAKSAIIPAHTARYYSKVRTPQDAHKLLGIRGISPLLVKYIRYTKYTGREEFG